MKGLCVRGSWRPNRTATYWPPTLLAITAFLSRSHGLLNRGPRGPTSLGDRFLNRILSQTGLVSKLSIGGLRAPLLGAGFLYRILSPTDLVSKTDWISCVLSYVIVHRPPSSCRRHKLHLFNPYTVKVILFYSSTGCTCYLHGCISYFDSPAGS